MKTKLRLHHCAKRIAPNSLEFVMALFFRLGCRESYWEKGARWAMIEQDGSNAIIQLIEVDQAPQATEMKRSSHIAFLSSRAAKRVVIGQRMDWQTGYEDDQRAME